MWGELAWDDGSEAEANSIGRPPKRNRVDEKEFEAALTEVDTPWQIPSGTEALQELLERLAADSLAPLSISERASMRSVVKTLTTLRFKFKSPVLQQAAKWGGTAKRSCTIASPENSNTVFLRPTRFDNPRPSTCPPPPIKPSTGKTVIDIVCKASTGDHILASEYDRERRSMKDGIPLKYVGSGGDGDEETILKKDRIVQRTFEILTQNGGSMSFGMLANDPVVQAQKFMNHGWMRSTLSERPDLVTIVGEHTVCLVGMEPEFREGKPRWVGIRMAPSPLSEGPLLVDPSGLAGKKLESLYQNKLRVALDSGDLPTAEALVLEARYRNGVFVNAQKLNWIVHANAKARRMAEAATWVERMEPEFDVKPTERTFAHLLDGFAAVGDTAGAETWLMKMGEYGLTPDIRSLNGMIKAFCYTLEKDRDMSTAERWFDRIKDFPGLKADSFSFGNLIYGCARRSNARRGAHWFSEMVQQGIAVSVEVCTFAFDAAASACYDDNEFANDFADSIVEQMRAERLRCDKQCWAALVRAVGKDRCQLLFADL